jgi:tRNA dimethylallyltransferase
VTSGLKQAGFLADVADQILVIAGPTASGKSSLALELATLKGNVEIVCMDSMQIYEEMKIGTARPDEEDLARAPHHLFGVASLLSPWTSITYGKQVELVIRDILRRGKIPLLVGGTGLYMKTLFEGLDPLPQTPPDLRQRLDKSAAKHGRQWLYRLLERLDPRGAGHLHANDSQRIQRFLEVRILTGQSILEAWQTDISDEVEKRPRVVGCLVERPLLWQRIEKRTHQMFEQGWVEETKVLRAKGLEAQVHKAGPIGYRWISKFLDGEITKEKAIERIVIETRRYAKRQMTWFRKIEYIRWFPFHPNLRYNTESITDFVWDK